MQYSYLAKNVSQDNIYYTRLRLIKKLKIKNKHT